MPTSNRHRKRIQHAYQSLSKCQAGVNGVHSFGPFETIVIRDNCSLADRSIGLANDKVRRVRVCSLCGKKVGYVQ